MGQKVRTIRKTKLINSDDSVPVGTEGEIPNWTPRDESGIDVVSFPSVQGGHVVFVKSSDLEMIDPL